jgi:hypothetical protein
MYAMPEGESSNGVDKTNTIVLDRRAEASDHGIFVVWESVQYTLDALRAPSAGKHYEASGRVVTDGEGRLLGLSLLLC